MSKNAERECDSSTMRWIATAAVAVGLPGMLIGAFLIHAAGNTGQRTGLQNGFEIAARATGFVGCGKKGEPMMRMPLQECADLKAFLASHSGQGTYVVYTDAPPPAPTR